MVSGRHKSHSFRKVFVKTPGARTTVHRVLRKPSRAVCGETGEFLHGVKTMRHTQLKNTAKSHKRPSRPFGGVLNSAAAKRELIIKARKMQ